MVKKFISCHTQIYLMLCNLKTKYSQLRTVDHSARRSMKNAANCAKHGELQGFMKPLLVERILQSWLTGQDYTHLRVEKTCCSWSDCSLVWKNLWTECWKIEMLGYKVATVQISTWIHPSVISIQLSHFLWCVCTYIHAEKCVEWSDLI